MNADQSLTYIAAHYGILPTYKDLAGIEQETSRETRMALLRANDLSLETDNDIRQSAQLIAAEEKQRLLPEEVVCSPDEPLSFSLPHETQWQLELEGDELSAHEGRVDEVLQLPDLPTGLHILTLGSGNDRQKVRLLCAPKTAPSLREIIAKDRIWGVNAALYGLSSEQTPSIGNYAMLAQAGVSFAGHGADFIGVNPVHAMGWNSSEIISPYSPTHRGFLNSNHIAVDQVTPRSQQTVDLLSAWRDATAAPSEALVNYERHHAHHSRILSALFGDFQHKASDTHFREFALFCAQCGVELRRYCEFEALSTQHGSDWATWPRQASRTGQTAINPKLEADRHLLFHAWLQWIAHQQLQTAQADCVGAGMALGLYLDLAVGARRDGAESWCESQSIAQGVSVGAPPDHLSPGGQNWNLAALAPKKLAADNYRTFRSILRQTMRHCGIIRIDHILGFNRSYWIPDDGSPGGYIKQNFETLMALVRLEASRSNTIVVGEDLGLVPDGFRDAMNRQNIYSYGVLQYEKDAHGNIKAPDTLRQKSLVCFGTHDTPTLAGFLSSKDIDWWQKLDWIDEEKGSEMREMRDVELSQILSLAGMKPQGAPIPYAMLRDAAYGLLANSQTAMVSAQLDDVFGSTEAQNLPGTIDAHPNWQQKYPLNVDQFSADARLAAMAEIMRRHARGTSTPSKRIR